MQTRGRVKEQNKSSASAPAVNRQAGQRTQHASRSSANHAPSEAGSRSSRRSKTIEPLSKLAQNPVARRGAPPVEGSIDISRRTGSDSEEEDEDEDEEEDGSEVGSIGMEQRPAQSHNSPEPADVSDSDEGQDSQADGVPEKAKALPELFSASRGLIKTFKSRHKNATSKYILDVAQSRFVAMRKLYENSELSPFLDWEWMHEEPVELIADFPDVMATANIATTLMAVNKRPPLENEDLMRFLQKLNETFPALFGSAAGPESTATLALDIRTGYFIEHLAAQPADTSGYDSIASVFCSAAQRNAEDTTLLLRQGPYVSLGTGNEEQEASICNERIVRLIGCIKRASKAARIQSLRQAFPAQKLCKDIRAFMLAAFASLEEAHARRHSTRGSPEEGLPEEGFLDEEPLFFDDDGDDMPLPRSSSEALAQHHSNQGSQEESLPVDGGPVSTSDDDNDLSESQGDVEPQAIVRHGSADNIGTLFDDPGALEFLREPSRELGSVPPSNQEQRAPSVAASDYQDSNSRLLRDFSSTISSRNNLSLRPSSTRPVEDDDEEADSDDEDDPFETDTRQVRPQKHAMAAVTVIRAEKRRRVGNTTTSMPPPPVPSSRQPESTGPASSLPSSLPPPQHPYLAASQEAVEIIEAERQKLRKYRAPKYTDHPGRLRQPWSSRDCAMLIELVWKHQARWADIERHDSDCFEIKRNQQAYRDKARNYKVDLLLTDAVLPPAFDFVVLGSKEIARVKSFHKNPFRKESDVEDGQAINTELVSD
ncbi:hypothetical protein B0I35DRAFT_414121 [Stachybotrys elegans]|uniref:Myb-like domain-containing protein n=1 Tax=Stachybotrys elegans TaxID=80388 RepID=A0A8K0SJI4_9HYPO|nr:hypothetical protein B0I35DRAFT_414121 [Stachybotrys elegans]